MLNVFSNFISQLMQSPTCLTYSTPTLIDHILTIVSSRLFQKGVIDVVVSYHQLNFSTRNISRTKGGGVHKY